MILNFIIIFFQLILEKNIVDNGDLARAYDAQQLFLFKSSEGAQLNHNKEYFQGFL